MIERTEFAKVMGVFADKIGRPLAPATFDWYLELLSDSLTTEQFLAGARIVFKTHGFNTWPPPQQFIDAVKPPVPHALEGAEFFDRCLRIVGHHGIAKSQEAKAEIEQLGPAVARAFRAAGGIREFTNVLESQVHFLRTRFVEAYEAGTIQVEQEARAIAALDRGAMDTRALRLVESTTRQIGQSPRDRALPTGDR